jgi:hypothetical protein
MANEAADRHSRPYAKASDLKAGATIQVDDSFTCIDPWECREVINKDRALCVICSSGFHYLEGQRDGDRYVGIYLSRKAEAA